MTMYCPIKHLLKWDLAKKLPLLEHPLHSSDLDPSLCNFHMNENTFSIIRQFTEIWQWSLNDFQQHLKAWQRHVWNYNISQHSQVNLHSVMISDNTSVFFLHNQAKETILSSKQKKKLKKVPLNLSVLS